MEAQTEVILVSGFPFYAHPPEEKNRRKQASPDAIYDVKRWGGFEGNFLPQGMNLVLNQFKIHVIV